MGELSDIMNIGAIGIFALLVVDKLIALVKKNGNGKSDHSVHISLDNANEKLSFVLDKVHELEQKVDRLPCERFRATECPNGNDREPNN